MKDQTNHIELTNAEGQPRRIGLELEFAGLELEEAAGLIQSLYGGEVSSANRYEYHIKGTRFGDFRVELDARILKKMADLNVFQRFGLNIDEKMIQDSVGDVVDAIAKTVIPLEIVMPPVQLEEIGELEDLRMALQENKAKGTGSSFMHAFGLHMNIEVPDLEILTILNYLRAFLVLYPWLLEELEIDLSRRISPFIDHFPEKFVFHVLKPEYDPDEHQFIEDYLRYNPTRNRPLDLLPVLALMDSPKIDEALGDEKNRPRPTFHYRLPNSRIEDPDWSFRQEWGYWAKIEGLASKKDMLDKLSELYMFRKGATVVSFSKEWAQTLRILLDLDE